MKKPGLFSLFLFGVVVLSFLITSAGRDHAVAKSPGADPDGQDDMATDSDDLFKGADRMFKDFFKDFHGDHERFFSRMDDDVMKSFDEHFKEMEQLRKEMESRFQGFDSSFGRAMDRGGDLRLQTREDDRAIYYDIDIGEVKPEDLKVDINGNMVTVTGKVSRSVASNDRGVQEEKQFYSQFVQSFPVPAGVDVNKSDVRIKEKKIEIEFPKN